MSSTLEALKELKKKIRQVYEQDMTDVDMLIDAQEKREASRNEPVPEYFSSARDTIHDTIISPASNHLPISDVIVLAVNSGVGTPRRILEYLKKNHNIETTSNSVNTRLSKLKAAHKISHDGKRWVAAPKNSGAELAGSNS